MVVSTTADIDKTLIVGAGEMGRGIAAVAALSGYEVTLQDIDAEQLNDAIDHVKWGYSRAVENGAMTQSDADEALDRLTCAEDLTVAASDPDVAIEAVVERLAIKRDIFETLDETAPADALLVTNTSGLNVTALAESTARPEQVLGMHWFNPPMLMDLVEVVLTEHTPEPTASLAEDLVESFGKTPIRCRRDVPNFIVNRLMRPFIETASWLVHLDAAEVQAVDAAMTQGEGFPMGPFELCDYTGAIQIHVEGEQDHLTDERLLSYHSQVCPFLHDLYEKGHYGQKTGRGVYDYSEQDAPTVPDGAGAGFDPMLVWAPIVNEAAKMVQHDVVTVEDIDLGAELGGNWSIGPFAKADEMGAKRVVRSCVEVASLLAERAGPEHFEKTLEVLPCDLLVETARQDGTFH